MPRTSSSAVADAGSPQTKRVRTTESVYSAKEDIPIDGRYQLIDLLVL